MSRHDPSLDWLALQEHALQVPCPHCDAPIGEPCRHLVRAPACLTRIRDADTAHPDTRPPDIPTAPARPDPGRRLRPADQCRADLAPHREPCRHCHHPIVWATNPAGDRLPVDADPTPDDTHATHCTLHVDDRGPRAVLLTPGQIAGARAAGARLHTPHRETCIRGEIWSRHKR